MSDDRLDAIRYLARSLERVVAVLFGEGVTLRSERHAGGGSINDARMLELTDGTVVFLKRNSVVHEGLFEEEARGLLSLAEADGPRVPNPLALFTDGTSQFLLLEYVEEGLKGRDFFPRFGGALARLHRSNRSERSGFEHNNHIGSTPQINRWTEDWFEFFGRHRLMYQAELARRQGYADETMLRQARSLAERLPDLLPAPEEGKPSLLHGDLWGGNYMVDAEGEPVLIDPAVYYGHREADLAMTELFGGFPPAFYRAYRDEWALEPGYEKRRDIYNLYHLLNHLNLFGGGYLGSCRAILRRFA